MSDDSLVTFFAILVGWFVVMTVGAMILAPDHRPAPDQPQLSEKDLCIKWESDQPARLISARCLKYFK